jgi:hypothetical protein
MDAVTKRISLDQLPVGYAALVRRRPLGGFSRAHLKAAPFGDEGNELGQALYSFTTKILAGKIASDDQEFSFDIPVTWWQHWKGDHAGTWYGAWIARRWPPRYQRLSNTVRFRQYAAYPLAELPDVPPSEFGFPVIWEMTDLRKPLEAGMRHVFLDNPRAEFMTRSYAEHTLYSTLVKQFVSLSLTDPLKDVRRLDITAVFDALEHLGVNTAQLITKTSARDRGEPADEED